MGFKVGDIVLVPFYWQGKRALPGLRKAIISFWFGREDFGVYWLDQDVVLHHIEREASLSSFPILKSIGADEMVLAEGRDFLEDTPEKLDEVICGMLQEELGGDGLDLADLDDDEDGEGHRIALPPRPRRRGEYDEPLPAAQDQALRWMEDYARLEERAVAAAPPAVDLEALYNQVRPMAEAYENIARNVADLPVGGR